MQSRHNQKSVKRMTLHSPERVAQLAQGFHLYVHRVLQTGLISWIVNFDEVPMSLLGSTLADEESDKEKLQRIIQAEVAAAAAVPAAPKKVSKQMAGLAASAVGTRSLLSLGFTRRPLFAPPLLEILTQAPFDVEELIGANEQTQQQ